MLGICSRRFIKLSALPGSSLRCLVPFASAFHPQNRFPKKGTRAREPCYSIFTRQRESFVNEPRCPAPPREDVSSLRERGKKKEERKKGGKRRKIIALGKFDLEASNQLSAFLYRFLVEEEVGEIGVFKDTARIGVEYHRQGRRGTRIWKKGKWPIKRWIEGPGTAEGRPVTRENPVDGRNLGTLGNQSPLMKIPRSKRVRFSSRANFFSWLLFFFFFLFFSFLRISRVTSHRGSRVFSTVLLHPRKVCAFAVNTLETVDECLVIRYLDFGRDRNTRRRWSRSVVLLDSRVSIEKYLLISPNYHTTIDSLSREKWLLL